MAADKWHTAEYLATRKHYQHLRANGVPLTCRRCGEPIRPDEPMDVGHPDPEHGHTGLAPEHATCNRGAGGKDARRRDRSRVHPLAL